MDKLSAMSMHKGLRTNDQIYLDSMTKKLKTISKQEKKRLRAKILRRAGVGISKTARLSRLSKRSIYRLDRRGSHRRPGSRGTKKLSRGTKISIRNTIDQNPFLTPIDLVDRLNLTCGGETVRKCLIRMGYKYRQERKKEALEPEDESQRLTFSLDWLTFQFWDYVIFTDETGYWINDHTGKGWFKSNQDFIPGEIESREKINIWGGVSMRGKVAIGVYRENLNQDVYLEILRRSLIPRARQLYPYGFFLQYDNLKVHTAGRVLQYLDSLWPQTIQDVLPWPNRSPDLNPLENVWAVLKRNIRKRQAQSLNELERIILEEWEALDEEYVQSVCETITLRLYECFEAGGHRLDY